MTTLLCSFPISFRFQIMPLYTFVSVDDFSNVNHNNMLISEAQPRQNNLGDQF